MQGNIMNNLKKNGYQNFLIDKLSAFESLKYKKEENLKEAREE
jgi:hypothetical protein